MNDKRNVVECVSNKSYTKKELLYLINKCFPDDEVGDYGHIATITTSEMTDGSVMQTVLFGKVIK